MFMKFVIGILAISNPRIFLWLYRHAGHSPKGYSSLEEMSSDYRYVTMKCSCGKRVERRLHGVRPVALAFEDLIKPSKR